MKPAEGLARLKTLKMSEEQIERARKIVQWYREHRRWFKLGQEALRTIYYARDGGVLSTAAAFASMGATVVDNAFPETSLEDVLRRRGYHRKPTAIRSLLCSLLLHNGTPTVEIAQGGERIRIWERGGEGAAVIQSGDRYVDGPYVLGGDESYLLDAISKTVWAQGTDIMLTAKSSERGFDLVPIPDPGPYIGKPGPEHYAERLARYGDRPRTILIKGPTGVGKSVLARHIASLAAHETARTLKVSSSVLRGFGSAELRDLARYVRPSVFLLDDLDVARGSRGSRFDGNDDAPALDTLLDTLETLRVEGCLVILTMMVNLPADKDLYRGEHYVPGMRPGRLDEIVCLYPPDSKVRGEILKHYYKAFGLGIDAKTHQKITKETEGLTGAYLREVVERLDVHGVEALAPELISVMLSAPPGDGSKGRRRRGSRRGAAIVRRSKRTTATPHRLRERAESCESAAERAGNKAEATRLSLLAKAKKLRAQAERKEQKAAERKAREKAKRRQRRKKP